MCYDESEECTGTFQSLLLQQKLPKHTRGDRHAGLLNSYLLNGNTFPVLGILLETTDHESVSTLLTPQQTNSEPIPVAADTLTFVKSHLTDILVYGSKTPYHGCEMIENLISEYTNINVGGPATASAMRIRSYVNREGDMASWSHDMSINRCDAVSEMMLANPTRGQPNNCEWYFNLFIQPNEATFSWVVEHYDAYAEKRKYYENQGGCYITWFSQMFATLTSHQLATKREQLWQKAKPMNEVIPPTLATRRVKRGDPDPSPGCSPEAKKPMYHCSQTPEIVAQVESKCIVDVMSEKGVESTPAFTPCGTDGEEAELMSLVDFDNQDENEPPNSYAAGTDNEVDAMMSRAGFFNHDSHNLKQSKICRKHSKELATEGFTTHIVGRHGVLRAKKRGHNFFKCVFPATSLGVGHDEATEVAKNTVLNKAQTEAVYRFTGKLVPVGLPVCQRHWDVANNFLAMYGLQKQPATPETYGAGVHPTRQRTEVCYQESSSQPKSSSQSLTSSQPLFCSDSPLDSWHSGSFPETSCPLPETQLERFRRILKIFKSENLIHNFHYTDKFNELSERTKANYRLASKSATNAINFALVGDDQRDFENYIQDASNSQWNKGHHHLKTSLQVLDSVYKKLSSPIDRKLALGVYALTVPYRILSAEVAGVTHYQYVTSRALARQYAVGEPALPNPAPGKMRLDPIKVRVFIEYTIDNMTPMPWGAKLKKTSCGKPVELPGYISQIRKKKQIKEYMEYLKQTEQQHLLMSRATYYRILKVLSGVIRYRKSTTGLDYKTNAGLEAFDRLHNVVCRMREIDRITVEQLTQFQSELDRSKSYLRGDYKYHVRQASTIADHCGQFALSDPKNSKWKTTCDHEHNDICQRCQKIKITLEELLTIAEDTEYDDDREKQLTIDQVKKSIQHIEEMKRHRLRSVHQNGAKTDILQTLQPHQALLIGDFAMKFLPTSGREDQTSFFGKRGINWHIFYAIRKIDDVVQYRIIQHVFASQVAQDALTVTGILNDTLTRLYDENGITEAYIKSDNAGSYR